MEENICKELKPKDWCIVAVESFLILLFIDILVAVNHYNPSGFIRFGIWFDILISSIRPFGAMVCSILFFPIFSKIVKLISVKNAVVKSIIFSVVVFLLCVLIGSVSAMSFLISSIRPFGAMVCLILFFLIFFKIVKLISVKNPVVKSIIFSVVVFLPCVLIGSRRAMSFLFGAWSNLLDMISFVYDYAVIDMWKYVMIYAVLMMLKIKKLENS